MLTIEGIDQALSNLAYWEKNTVKSRLLHLVRNHYDDESGCDTVGQIDPDVLISAVWDVHDPIAIRSKRRNLFSIKSTVNMDLQRLYESGGNPEGITLGPGNVFIMSDEAKDRILKNFSDAAGAPGGASLDQITKVLEVVKDILSDPRAFPDSSLPGAQDKLGQFKDLVRSLSTSFGTEPSLSPIPDKTTETGLTGNPKAEAGESDRPVEDTKAPEVMEADTNGDEIEMDPATEELPGDESFETMEQWELIENAGIGDELSENDEKEDDETSAGLGEDEVTDEIDDLDMEEDLETLIEEASEDTQGADENEDLEPPETVEGGGPERTGGLKEAGLEIGLPIDNLGQPFGNELQEDKMDKARLLAEEFDGFLGAMDRFYNQYLLIPEGNYRIGAKSPREYELPARTVTLPAFYMGKFPVTNALFEIFVEKTGYKTTAEKTGYGTVYEGRFRKSNDPGTGKRCLLWQSSIRRQRVEGACWYQPLGPGSNLHGKRHHPVVQVSLEDAMVFAAWTGKRLPSEEEWESAARTPEGYNYPWGNTWKGGACNLEASGEGDTTAVDKFILEVNEMGIVDSLGNVLEWTQDTAFSHSYGTNHAQYYVAKGGSWLSSHEHISLSARHLLEPDSRSNILGFRCLAF